MVGLTFFLIGMNKCGTTSLSALLRDHPDVLLPTVEEPWFFLRGTTEQDWREYETLFPRWRDYRAVGDDSTAYSSFGVMEQISSAIHDVAPQARIIFLLRDPIARMESAFREFLNSGVRYGVVPPLDFTEALLELPPIVEDSRYWPPIQRYREVFGADQVQVVYLEDLQADTAGQLGRVFDFIGVDPTRGPTGPIPQLNSADEKLQDSRLLRRARQNRHFGRHVAKVCGPDHEQMLRTLRLRRPAPTHIVWSEQARQIALDRVVPDIERLWQQYPRPHTGWPRFESLLAASTAKDPSR